MSPIMLTFSLLIFLTNLLCAVFGLPIETPVQQVQLGKSVVLGCESNDELHNFFYWHIEGSDIVIGPSNNQFDANKFKYEVLSGNLTIKAVSKQEEGIYHCVSRGVRDDNINVRSIRMIVHEDWVQLNESDPTVNHYRIAIVAISVLLLCGICFFAYRVWRDRYKNPSYLGTNDLDGQQTNTNPNNMCHMFCFYLLKAFLRCKTTKLKMISQSEEPNLKTMTRMTVPRRSLLPQVHLQQQEEEALTTLL